MFFADRIYLTIAFVSLGILAAGYFFIFRWKKNTLKEFAVPELLEKITANFSRTGQIWKAVLIILAVFLFFLSLSRPQWGLKKQEVERKGVDIMIALDTSLSMDTEDIKPTRLEKAKQAYNS